MVLRTLHILSTNTYVWFGEMKLPKGGSPANFLDVGGSANETQVN